MRAFITAIALALFATVNAAQHNISVGANSSLAFSPNNITASEGDTLVFTFESKNHTLTQSTFDAPCVNASGTDSGFLPVSNGTTRTFKVNVESSSPVWFYCAQTNHCKSGMVFALNPSADKTAEAFINNAKGAGNTTSPSGSPSGSSSPSSPTATGSSPSPSSSSRAMRVAETKDLGVLILAASIFGIVF